MKSKSPSFIYSEFFTFDMDCFLNQCTTHSTRLNLQCHSVSVWVSCPQGEPAFVCMLCLEKILLSFLKAPGRYGMAAFCTSFSFLLCFVMTVCVLVGGVNQKADDMQVSVLPSSSICTAQSKNGSLFLSALSPVNLTLLST